MNCGSIGLLLESGVVDLLVKYWIVESWIYWSGISLQCKVFEIESQYQDVIETESQYQRISKQNPDCSRDFPYVNANFIGHIHISVGELLIIPSNT